MPGDDVVAGCVRWLKADPAVVATVAVDSGGQPLIVQDTAPDRTEFVGAVAIVISHAGPAASFTGSTYEQVRLQVEFWSDPQRDPGGNLEAPDVGRRRMIDTAHAVDRRLNRPQGGDQLWGAVRTIDATRLAGLTPYLVPGSDGLWRGTAFYGVGLA